MITKLHDQGRSHSTITHTLGAIKQVLTYGITEGLVAVNVAASVKAPRKQHSKATADTKPKADPWTWEQLLEFRTIADQDEWAAAWRLTLCGLRRSEVLGIAWSAVDLANGEVTIKAGGVSLNGGRGTAMDDPKSTASRRTISVEGTHPGTLALLRSLKARQATDRLALGAGYIETDLVLVDPLGKPVRPELYSDHFARLCYKAELPRIRLHSVRDVLATKLNQLGVAPVDAASYLGHTTAVYLATYAKRTEAGARSAASALGAISAVTK